MYFVGEAVFALKKKKKTVILEDRNDENPQPTDVTSDRRLFEFVRYSKLAVAVRNFRLEIRYASRPSLLHPLRAAVVFPSGRILNESRD